MVEYILVVTVSVIIVIGLAQRMYKPLGDFIEGFMGTYVACLLETGELPILGANNSGSGECKVPIMGQGEDFGTDSAPPGSQANSNSNSQSDSDKVTSNRGDDGSAGGGGSGAGGRGGRSSRRFTVGAGTASGDGGSGRGGRKIVIALEGGGSGGAFFGNQSGGGGGSIYRRESRYVAVTGGMAQEAQQRAEKEANRSIKQKVDGDTGGGTQRKKTAVIPPPPKNTVLADEEIKGIDYSQIVKYILIAGIIIILLALIGGQALQLSKSWEKGE
ncbi:MAG: hypothetical protein KF789_04160 [Bdellovibrionaceae bacterium]|nr:hypothetical protein [Pseudobdellovibrionaceae bacterium]